MNLCVLSSDIILKNIHFTLREIDVLSGLVNGRSAKSIALLLNISPKTVETHIRNIMLKLECNSKEQILDFIEKSGHHRDFHQHYQDLLENTALEKILTKSSQRCQNNERPCFVVCLLQQANSVKCCQLVDHLKKAGLKVTHLKQIPQNFKNCNLILISNLRNTQDFISQFSENEQKSMIVVSENRLELSVPTVNVQDSYSKSILKILDIFYPYKITQEDVQSLQSYLPTHQSPAFARKNFLYHINDYPFWKRTLGILSLFLCFYISILIFRGSPETFRQDLQVMSAEHFLKRPQLVKKMDMILKNQKGLQTLVLIGPGGSGKTTLARYYARQQKARVIFEINVETATSRTEGLTNFARFLASTKKLKEKFCFIQGIENAQEKEKQLLHFIQSNLKNLKNWCLLFDNVEHFQDIRHIFPSDVQNWGNGKIILTSRNENIKNVAQITPSRTLYMEELNQDDCFVLFNKIYYNQTQPKLEKDTENQIRQFLKQIPSFPLDISAAAHYMKNTDTTFKDYLKTMEKVDLRFDQMQSHILQENLGYSKTRYRIISTTFQKILEGHPEFKEILFFICLIDAQNIPKELLYQCQPKQCIDEFLYYLKQHSFIDENREYFSIHRSIQEKGLTCILNILTQSEINCYLQKILSALTPPLCWFYYPNAKHYSKDSHFLIPHLKTLLYKIDRIHFIEPIYKDKIISQILLTLGHIYYVWNSYMQIAENYYRCILEKDQYKNALSMYDQAVLYVNLGHALLIEGKYKDGGIYIKKSLELTCHFENPKPLKIMGLALLSLYYAYAKPFSNKYKEIASQALNLLTKPKEPWEFYVQYHLFDIMAGNHLSNPLSPTDILLGRDYSLKSAELMGRLHNSPPSIPLRGIESYLVLGKPKEALELCKIFEKQKKILKRKKSGTTTAPDLFFLRIYSKVFLRIGELRKAEQQGMYVLNAFRQRQEKRRIADTMENLIEVKIRLAKLSTAYKYYLHTIDFFKKTNIQNISSKLSILTLYYHAALIKYLQKDIVLSLQHFANFFNTTREFCQKFLKKEQYDELIQNNVFEIIDDPQQITRCLDHSLLIFTAIYGPNHPFVKDYIAKKGNLYTGLQRCLFFIRDIFYQVKDMFRSCL